MTFDELCDTFDLTPEERREAAWYLAFLRMRKTIEALLGGIR